MDSDGYGGIIFIAAAALIKAFFTVCETAMTEVDDRKVRNGGATTLSKLLEKPSRLVTTFAVNRTLTSVVIAYAAAFACMPPLAELFSETFGGGIGEILPELAAAVCVLFAAVLLLTVFCEGIPKRLAVRGSEQLAEFCAPFVKYLVIFLTPLTALTSALIKLLSPSSAPEKDVVTEEEILMMVDAGNETGVIEESQREMINNVFEFGDLTLSDVMTHRTDIVAVKSTAPVSEIVNAAIESGVSRIPVYEDTIDHIIGMICVKDLLCFVGSEAADGAEAKNFVRDIPYLPETVTCGEAFKRFTAERVQIAAVIDEYGGTAGIVTMEDIVETIVGNIRDEYDDEYEELVSVSEDTYMIAGTADPEKILPKLGITLPEGNGFNTMSGFIVELLGRIPEENENPAVEYENILFTVLVTEDKCITKIKATLISEENKNSKESKKNEEET